MLCWILIMKRMRAMFNVTRTYPAPPSVERGSYNRHDVLEALRPMFYDKCYLCERDDIQDVEVEHFNPHQNDATLKYSWENLFYSCSRCNSIKSNTHINLLDCTNSAVDVGSLIRCRVPSAPSDDVSVEVHHPEPTLEMLNTARLINECYNLKNTALREISRESLMEQIWEHYAFLLNARQTLSSKRSAQLDKQRAIECIQNMLDVSFPFSILWRNYYLCDSFLVRKYPELQVGF